jgi:C4-dicarboxylate-specific signal transduction histidine kinase
VAGVSVGSDCEGDPELTADRAQLGVLICHLLRNGCEALRGASRSGAVVVSGRAVEDCVELTVEDNGPGLGSAEVLRHAFDPFYSGRSAGRGLGFGLCVSWRIVRQHGGAICLENLPSGGVCCRIALPQRPPVP